MKSHCDNCLLKRPASGHDPCIANLPGITDACCGHGKRKGYLAFENGIVIRGHFDIERWSEKPFKIEILKPGKGWRKKPGFRLKFVKAD